MNLEKVSVLLEKIIEEKKSNPYKLAEETGLSRRYIRDILKKEEECGSKESIEKILNALEVGEKEKIKIWTSWLFQKGFVDVAMFLNKNNK